ncbi:shikimate dehydrogenase [Helicobacter cetorum]|uniref:Shikimate dehydrogenase (NADP(+)) n=1 Tax=Helicobacter cetorum (strain ATCC BAA-540 / CCUG 52418 / MIT 99-5656) TaxID=1163745 RepID=I0EQ84_HELCM|nr:shikimate dehydrogenase [Helicobacter cetorum]AFI05103.1 shikimate 5-dehydrogenase [Helicobacter cetorum MIT 99-5656]
MVLKSFGVFGNPIKHSKSPLIHNACFLAYQQSLGFLGHYHPILLPLESHIKDEFLGLGLSGANVTLPFKERAFQICDEVRGIALECKSVNTLVLENNQLVGYNTDALGFYLSLKHKSYQNALILGSGGSAKALACGLKEQGLKVSVLSRSANHLDFFEQLGCACFTNAPKNAFDLIINATSASLNNELPLDKEILKGYFKESKLAYDLMYGVLTPFLSLAKDLNINFQDGKDMLVYQASLSFEKFSSSKISYSKAFEIMRSVF